MQSRIEIESGNARGRDAAGPGVHRRFHIRELAGLRDEIRRLGLDLPLSENRALLGEPLSVAGRTVPNRFLVQPMEGFDASPRGEPGALAFRRYRRYARGGFGMIWIEATAVLEAARSNPSQFWLHEGSADRFAGLIDAIRRTAREAHGRDVTVIMQLTHSGRYSKPTGIPRPLIAHHSPVLDPRHRLPEDYPLLDDDYLDRLQETYVAAARLAARAGVDGVDVKSCHRYLVSELLASFTREGRYGGSFENRTRFLRETLARIRDALPGLIVTTRMNAYDAIGYPYGFGVDREDYRLPDLSEPLRLARELAALGVPLLNVSLGNPYFNPHYGRPYDFPCAGVTPPREHPLEGMARFVGIVRAFQQELPDVPVAGAGYTWVRQFLPYVAAGALETGGVSLAGLGRGAFAYPDTPRDVLEHGCMDPARCCVTCSGCTQIMRDGARTGCVVRDAEIYGPEYRRGRRFALDRLQAEARRCRECEEATCVRGCPAGVDVPAFVRAFADGDIRSAYEVLRRSNLLPEMCGFVCPAGVQCQGECLEDIFREHPIPIQDIQLVTCRIARREGYTGVRLPEAGSGRRVAVAGGGPAGVAAAAALLERGHAVTVIEAGGRLGGTPQAVIPRERYADADEEIAALLAPARAAGRLEVRLDTALGRDLALDELRGSFDAVLLAFGLGAALSLGRADGVVDALTFLRQAKAGEWREVPPRVAVLGGGNTALDAGSTALELGARDVYLVYRRSFGEMPAWPREREAFVKAGGHCLVLTQPLGYETDEAGRLTGLRVARTELGAPDASGRRRPAALPGTEHVLPVELVVEALGQRLSETARAALADLGIEERGLVRTRGPASAATAVPGLFAAGDLVNGGTTVVRGVREGMDAAEQIDAWLRGGSR